MAIHWVLIISMVVIYGQVLLFNRYALKCTHYDRRFDQTECYAGDEIQLIEQISNRKLLPLPWLRLEAVMSASLEFAGQTDIDVSSGEMFQNHSSLFSLMAYTEITRRHSVHCLKRGYFFVNSTTMTSGDLLGLTRVHKQLYVNCHITVFPRTIPIDEIPLPTSKWLGDFIVRRWIVEDPFFNLGVREYRAGDSMNTIHWKATARSGKMQVNQRAFTADHKLMILLNIDDSPNMWNVVTNPERIEKGIVYAASIAEYVMKQGIPTGFSSNGRLVDGPLRTPINIQSQNVSGHLSLLLEAMAKLELKRSIPFEDLLAQVVEPAESSTDCLIITSYVNKAMEQEIDRLHERGHTLEIMWLQDIHHADVKEIEHADTAS